jgi:predicted CXXCH cytochrome family protein
MKKILVAVALAAFAQAAQATIAGGKHDLTLLPGAAGVAACQYCHAPHNVNTGVAGTPLWNRNLPVAGGFTVYASTTMNATVNPPGPNSLTCLSCHDGVGNMGDTFVGTDSPLTTPQLVGYALVGTNLGNDHPVGIAYPVAVPGQFKDISAAATPLYATRVECGSCHDPHGTSDAGTGGLSFLRTGPGVDLCAVCHDK